MFGRATITFGIGPHSSYYYYYGRPIEQLRQAIIFLPSGFFPLSSSFFIFSSPNLSGRRLDVHHTSTHAVAEVRI